ncbi:hypothetical protein Dtox_2530 [Desulfofarcimen acetoxidans DSM 771]|uniref:Uncharacterized protein n=1 Tax=Desulfofarcimen acetoxidans (strain ATCC 49208 / DSM 771 / KCTC 5769 / VKM B-1644 / 5575) TaxID=485916 RepID=C8W0S7_DESAS|nr:hypothetical protein [Desulfofarcimen acetoxidans]ACV63332.1 hypothetical protein Dtox_2530 [Desulfofarcimen acetoxidans DSM 771]
MIQNLKNANTGGIIIAKIFIQIEKAEDVVTSFKIVGKLKALYYFGVNYSNYVTETEKFLFDFLVYQNRFPIFFYFEADNDFKNIVGNFNANQIDYTLDRLADKSWVFSIKEGLQKYNIPLFRVRVENTASLKVVLNEAFCLASSNQRLFISFGDNLTYYTKKVKNWQKRILDRSILNLSLEFPTTFIKVCHDGQGFHLYTSRTIPN